MGRKEIADRLKEAAAQANTELEKIRSAPDMGREKMAEVLRRYAARRLMLDASEVSDNITKMVRIHVSKTMHIPEEELKNMDKPGMCGSAPAVLSLRILMFLAVQEQLGVKLPAQKTPDIQTVQDLAELLIPLLART